jgi:hypothetical protein
MTSNDAQMEVLLRRYAGKSQSGPATEHLDPDELNAFAEGAVPEAARTRYLSHLIDCDSCRQVVSQLAITSGKVLAPAAIPADEPSGVAWWKRLSGFFSPMTLRYAAFAMVLIAVAGVVFLVTRRPRESGLVAQNEQTRQAPESAVKPLADAPSQTAGTAESQRNTNRPSINPTPPSPAAPTLDQGAKLDSAKTGDSPASSLKPAKEGDYDSSRPALAAAKKAEPVTEVAPSYAPPPPPDTGRLVIQRPEQPKTTGVASSGPRKSEPADRFKMMDKAAPAGESGKDNRSADDNTRFATNSAAVNRRAGDEKPKGPRRDLENNRAMSRNVNEVAGREAQAGASQSVIVEEKAPETRSAGGRKFRRQGNSWVDTKFKSSMTVKSISRGSSEFNALDSGLRAMAQQLSGEVLVVWKNKAYLIR